jgi:hypothetical protein
MAIASASTEIDAKGYMAHKALVQMRINESMRLFNTYLEARPNDELTRSALFDAALLASNHSIMSEIISHWRARALSDIDSANNFSSGAYRVIDLSIAADFIEQIMQRWPNNTGIIYQAHRTNIWAGRIQEAKQLVIQYQRLVPEGATLMSARQACVEGDRQEAERLLASMDPQANDLAPERWHMLKMLGRDREANDELQVFENGGIPYMIADMLVYPQFDPTPYPSLMAALDREAVQRPPPA